MKEIKLIFIEEGAMSEESIQKLETIGFAVIKIKDSSKIKLASDIGFISDNIIVNAAIETISSYKPDSGVFTTFGNKIMQEYKKEK